MQLDLDTFLVTVYTIVDELYQTRFAPHKPKRRGCKPALADSEVLTLALLAQWEPHRSETAFIDYAVQHWRSYFPHLVSRSDFNRRLRDVAGVLNGLGPAIYTLTTQQFGWHPAYEVLDGVPVPVMRRCRGNHHRLFGYEVAVGHGGSDDEWYYGVKLLASVSATGMVTGFVVAAANTDERWATEALLVWRHAPDAPLPTLQQVQQVLGPSHKRGGQRRGPTGPFGLAGSAGVAATVPYLADLGFRGVAWRKHWCREYGATVLLKSDYLGEHNDPERRRARQWLCGLRQQVETAFGGLTETFGLKFPRAHSWWGLLARIGAKVAAFNLAIHINHLFERPTFAFFNPLG